MNRLLLRCDGFNYKKLSLLCEMKEVISKTIRGGSGLGKAARPVLDNKTKRRGSLKELAIGDHIPILPDCLAFLTCKQSWDSICRMP
jgi:hypothetical protein